MHVTVRHYSGNTDLVDALVAHEDEVHKLISEIDGFQSYYLVRTGGGDAMSISVYENAAQGDESVSAARDWIKANLDGMQVGPPQVLAGDTALTF